MSDSFRAFVGIWPSADVAARLATAQDEMRGTAWGRAIRWTPTDKVHLTLLFLGQVKRSTLPEFLNALRDACAAAQPFQASCRGIGCFPNLRRPSVLWAGLTGNGSLNELHREVRDRAGPFGDHREEKPFRPHLTIARVKRLDAMMLPELADDLKGRASMSFGDWMVDSVSLVESRLQPSGLEYLPIESFRLVAR